MTHKSRKLLILYTALVGAFLGLSSGSFAGTNLFGLKLFGDGSCTLGRDTSNKTGRLENARLQSLSDQAIRDEAAADLKSGDDKDKCKAARTLSVILDRYPIVNIHLDDDGHPVSDIVVKEPDFYIDVYLQVVGLLNELKEYASAAELLKHFLQRFQTYPNNDYVLMLLGETYTLRVPQNPSLDTTAALKAQSQYALLVTQYPDSIYKNVALERLRFIKTWLERHELEIAKEIVASKHYYPALLRLKAMYDTFKRYKYTNESDDMAQDFFLSCRAWMRIGTLPEDKAPVPSPDYRTSARDSSENALQALRIKFPHSPWRELGEQYCGIHGKDSDSGPETKSGFRKVRKFSIPEITLPFDGKIPPIRTAPPKAPPKAPDPAPAAPTVPATPAAPSAPDKPKSAIDETSDADLIVPYQPEKNEMQGVNDETL